MAGEAEDLVCGQGSGKVAGRGDGLMQGFGGLVVRDEDEAGAVGGLDEAWQV